MAAFGLNPCSTNDLPGSRVDPPACLVKARRAETPRQDTETANPRDETIGLAGGLAEFSAR